MVQFLCQKINNLVEFTEKSSGVCRYGPRGKLINGLKIAKRLDESL